MFGYVCYKIAWVKDRHVAKAPRDDRKISGPK
jgi:hypothetical protein